VLPPDYTFAAGVGGTATFQATINTAGSQTVTVTDDANPKITGKLSVIAADLGNRPRAHPAQRRTAPLIPLARRPSWMASILRR
jgi:hypothetical protein